jgi:hypothetical protein
MTWFKKINKNSDGVSLEFCCSICHEIFMDPVIMPCCGKSFDRVCLERHISWVDKHICSNTRGGSTIQPGCPNCREAFHKDINLINSIDLKNVVERRYPNQVAERRLELNQESVVAKLIDTFRKINLREEEKINIFDRMSPYSYSTDGVKMLNAFMLDLIPLKTEIKEQLRSNLDIWKTAFTNNDHKLFVNCLIKHDILDFKRYFTHSYKLCAWMVAIDYHADEILNIFIVNGFDVNKSYQEISPLGYACKNEDPSVSIVSFLIQSGADINIQDFLGNTPLHDVLLSHYANDQTILNLMTLLLHHGAKTNLQNDAYETPLYIAAQKGSADQMQLLLAKNKIGGTPEQHPKEISPIWTACAHLNADVLEILWNAGERFEPLILSNNTTCFDDMEWKNRKKDGITPVTLILHKMNSLTKIMQPSDNKYEDRGEKMIKFLFSKLPGLKNMSKPIVVATLYGYTNIVYDLMIRGVEINQVDVLLCLSEHVQSINNLKKLIVY